MDRKAAYLFFDCRGQATGLPPSRLGVAEDQTTTRFLDPYMGLKAALFGLPTVDQMLGKSRKCENFKLHLYAIGRPLKKKMGFAMAKGESHFS
ncbi:hypothetical protein [Geobacillus sp. Y412MC52]|uniref:hypothetical protein n=1 Tax=Geobacillus sp. (strain Y412MC52) TaxID=550542 RepID=UPI001184E405|nr:hypothetical protein [Geobacillus sp. Y412MC52]